MSVTQLGGPLGSSRLHRSTDVGPSAPDGGCQHPAHVVDRRSAPELAGLVILLVAATTLFAWDLTVSGYANAYYAAAAHAGSESWKALLFGSLDPHNAITVDKPPLSLWPMAISVRLFGMSSLSILLPQVLEGVATVAVLHHIVRRATGSPGAALVAGAAFALTPVAVLMFRYDNPDALLTLLLVSAAATTLRSLDSSRPARWMTLTGVLVGAAFLDKLGQALLVLPALGLTHLLFASSPIRDRTRALAWAAFAATLIGGSWIAVVQLWPSGSRPWIGGTSNNSAWQLALGYNGIGRLTGNERGASGLTGGWHATNFARMFGGEVGGEVMWLVPAAVILAAGALWSARSRALPRATKSALVMWLIWFGVMMTVFCLMGGIFHSYYTITLAPAVAALVGIGGHVLWTRRDQVWVARLLGWTSVATTLLAATLVVAHPGKLGWLLPTVAILGLGSTSLFVIHRVARPVAVGVLLTALAAALVAPTAYAVATTRVAHAGSAPMAGPVAGHHNGHSSAKVINTLRHDASRFRWVAAVPGSRAAATYELLTGKPVLSIGGFAGTDPAPTLAQFQTLVKQGKIHYFIDKRAIGTTGAIATWVRTHFTKISIKGTSLFDLSGGAR